MLILSVTGRATWFGGSETADVIRTTLKLPLLVLVLLHFGAARLQQFVLRTGLMNRMLRAEKQGHRDRKPNRRTRDIVGCLFAAATPAVT